VGKRKAEDSRLEPAGVLLELLRLMLETVVITMYPFCSSLIISGKPRG
jgi:hypothetical protein